MHLSPRETEILRYIAAGHTTKELAAALNIAESTAEWHISNILVKLGAASRAEAVAIGVREGLLEAEEQPLKGRSGTDLAARRPHRARTWRDDGSSISTCSECISERSGSGAAGEILRRHKQGPWVLSPARPETATVQTRASNKEKRFRRRVGDTERRVSYRAEDGTLRESAGPNSFT